METKKLDFLKYKGSLAHVAFDSRLSLGRRYEDNGQIGLYENMVDPFLIDSERIRLSKSFRRLGFKTQVFSPFKNANFRNRLTHTIEVAHNNVFVSKVLGLNVNLSAALSEGHDIGQNPFGHLGERVISKFSQKNFRHSTMSVVVAQEIEHLNLSYEVLLGFLYHSLGKNFPHVGDKQLLQEIILNAIIDTISYIFSDLEDFMSCDYHGIKNLPTELVSIFGKTRNEMISNTLFALIKESSEKGLISFSESEIAQIFLKLRSWMYKNIYNIIDIGKERIKFADDLEMAYGVLQSNQFFRELDSLLSLAILTDDEVYKILKHRRGRKLTVNEINELGFLEVIDSNNRNIDIFNPDLNPADFKRM